MSKQQTTAKTVVEALNWVENNEHHEIRMYPQPTTSMDVVKGVEYIGYHQVLRVPNSLSKIFASTTKPGDDMDRRMYRANKKGRALLISAGYKPQPGVRSFRHE